MATSGNFSTSNSYIKYKIIVDTSSQSVINNTSNVRIRVQAWRTNSGYTTDYAGTCYVKVDSTEYSNSWSYGSKPITYNSNTTLYDSTKTITHNSNGTKTITVAAKFNLTASGSTKVSSSYQSFNVTLSSLDRTEPTVTITPSGIGVDSFSLSAATDVACDVWEYSLDGGSTFTQYSTTSGTSASTSITGLSPNTTYTTLVKARKTSNHVYGTSTASSVKTIGNTILNSVSTVTADAATVTITFNVSMYITGYTHTLTLKNGSTSVLSFTGLTLVDGNNTITLTSAQRTSLLTHMATMKTFTGTFELTSYESGTQIGNVSTAYALVQTTAATSAPTFSNFTYQDNNVTTSTLTGNNQVMIQGFSTLQATASAATAKNNASIVSYSVTFGNITGTSSTTTITPTGSIDTSGTVVLTVSAIDSRGYSTSVSKNVTVVPYEAIYFNTADLDRVNSVEDTVKLSFNGTISSILISSVEKNSITYCRYRYKKSNETTYGSYVDIVNGVTTSGTTFSYLNNALTSLDANYSWDVEVLIKDALTETDIYLEVTQGIPFITFKKVREEFEDTGGQISDEGSWYGVGINNPNPQHTLDVDGDSMFTSDITSQSGVYVVGELTDTLGFRSGSNGHRYIEGKDTSVTTDTFLEIDQNNNIVGGKLIDLITPWYSRKEDTTAFSMANSTYYNKLETIVPTDGMYLAISSFELASKANVHAVCGVFLDNGDDTSPEYAMANDYNYLLVSGSTAFNSHISTSRVFPAHAGDKVYARLYQTSGGALNCNNHILIVYRLSPIIVSSAN